MKYKKSLKKYKKFEKKYITIIFYQILKTKQNTNIKKLKYKKTE